MKKLTIFVVAVALIAGVAQAAPTASDIENWLLNALNYNVTYLDLTRDYPGGPSPYVGDTNGGLTLTTDSIWGYPDGSDSGYTVNEDSMDTSVWSSPIGGDDVYDPFQATITGLAANTDYDLGLIYIGDNTSEFTWGTVADGNAINVVNDLSASLEYDPDADRSDHFMLIGTFTSDAGGTITLWLGATNESRAQFDGLVVLTPSDIAFGPDPADGASNVPLDTDLRWHGPTDSNESWTYDVYFDGSSEPIATVSGADPNVPNSVLGTLSVGSHTWSVDSTDPNGPVTWTGDTWTFNAGVTKPTLPSPEDGTGGYGLELILQWTSDNSTGLIDHHKLVLNNVDDGTSVTVDSIPVANSSYDLGNQANPTWAIMQYGQTWEKQYTWQIIEVGAGGEVLAEGDVWHFGITALQCNGWATVWGDLNGDCKAGLEDIAWIADAWLDCGWQLAGEAIPYPEKDPCLW